METETGGRSRAVRATSYENVQVPEGGALPVPFLSPEVSSGGRGLGGAKGANSHWTDLGSGRCASAVGGTQAGGWSLGRHRPQIWDEAALQPQAQIPLGRRESWRARLGVFPAMGGLAVSSL